MINTERTVALCAGVRPSGMYASAGSMSKALETSSPVSAIIGKPAFAPATFSMSAFHFLWSSTPSTETPITLVPRAAHSSASCATAPNSVVQTGVKSFGCENKIAQESPIQSCNWIVPWSVSTVIFGIVSLIRRLMVVLLIWSSVGVHDSLCNVWIHPRP